MQIKRDSKTANQENISQHKKKINKKRLSGIRNDITIRRITFIINS